VIKAAYHLRQYTPAAVPLHVCREDPVPTDEWGQAGSDRLH